MTTAIDSALSGLAAASRRVEVSANNIANQSSTSTQVNGVTTNQPFIPQDVVQISLGSGGVRSEVRDASNPTSQQLGDDGIAETPNVDSADEMVKMQIASYDFKANLKTIQIYNRMQQNLLDMLS